MITCGNLLLPHVILHVISKEPSASTCSLTCMFACLLLSRLIMHVFLNAIPPIICSVMEQDKELQVGRLMLWQELQKLVREEYRAWQWKVAADPYLSEERFREMCGDKKAELRQRRKDALDWWYTAEKHKLQADRLAEHSLT